MDYYIPYQDTASWGLFTNPTSGGIFYRIGVNSQSDGLASLFISGGAQGSQPSRLVFVTMADATRPIVVWQLTYPQFSTGWAWDVQYEDITALYAHTSSTAGSFPANSWFKFYGIK